MGIYPSNANHHFESDEPVWELIAEFSFSDVLPVLHPKDRLAAEPLFQAARDSGAPPECLEMIAGALAALTKEALARGKPGEPESVRGRICVFCQKKVLSGAAARPFHTGQPTEPARTAAEHDEKMNGGWGYYVIERGNGFTRDPGAGTGHVIELFIYKEGR